MEYINEEGFVFSQSKGITIKKIGIGIMHDLNDKSANQKYSTLSINLPANNFLYQLYPQTLRISQSRIQLKVSHYCFQSHLIPNESALTYRISKLRAWSARSDHRKKLLDTSMSLLARLVQHFGTQCNHLPGLGDKLPLRPWD